MTDPAKARAAKNARLMKLYGITLEEWEGMAASQGGLCGFPLCDREIQPGKRFSVDHDHFTGEVRAIVCYQDNRYKIGSFTADQAYALYQYLTSPPARRYFGEPRFVPAGMEKGLPRRRRRRTVKRRPVNRGTNGAS